MFKYRFMKFAALAWCSYGCVISWWWFWPGVAVVGLGAAMYVSGRYNLNKARAEAIAAIMRFIPPWETTPLTIEQCQSLYDGELDALLIVIDMYDFGIDLQTEMARLECR